MELLHKDLTGKILGAAMEVHGVLGSGFLEPVYQEAMAHELTFCGVPSRREVELPIFYKGEKLHTSYRVDFICYESVVVEIKALARLGGTEEAAYRAGFLKLDQLEELTNKMPRCEYRDYLAEVVAEAKRLKDGK